MAQSDDNDNISSANDDESFAAKLKLEAFSSKKSLQIVLNITEETWAIPVRSAEVWLPFYIQGVAVFIHGMRHATFYDTVALLNRNK